MNLLGSARRRCRQVEPSEITSAAYKVLEDALMRRRAHVGEMGFRRMLKERKTIARRLHDQNDRKVLTRIRPSLILLTRLWNFPHTSSHKSIIPHPIELHASNLLCQILVFRNHLHKMLPRPLKLPKMVN